MGRPYRGSRLASFYNDVDSDAAAAVSSATTPSEADKALSSLDSAFQLQEYISALVRVNPHDVERIVRIPGKASGGGLGDTRESQEKSSDEDGVDEACWVYEQLRCVIMAPERVISTC